jgi:glycine cleavage system protein P-like pyridoxal-binding family
MMIGMVKKEFHTYTPLFPVESKLMISPREGKGRERIEKEKPV